MGLSYWQVDRGKEDLSYNHNIAYLVLYTSILTTLYCLPCIMQAVLHVNIN